MSGLPPNSASQICRHRAFTLDLGGVEVGLREPGADEEYGRAAKDAGAEDVAEARAALVDEGERVVREGERLAQERQPIAAGRKPMRNAHRGLSFLSKLEWATLRS